MEMFLSARGYIHYFGGNDRGVLRDTLGFALKRIAKNSFGTGLAFASEKCLQADELWIENR